MNAAHDCYENAYARFCIMHGILYFEYKPDTVISLTVARKVVSDRIQFQNETAYPVLCDIRGVINSDKAGRDYLAQSGSVLTKAVAILGNPKVSETMGDFYLKISKPIVPTSFFIDKEDALAFLKSYL
jgi:hypothetical protein